MTVVDQAIGRDAVVAAVVGTDSIGDRLMEMGVTPGVTIQVLRGGDPMQVLIRGYRLSLRRTEAACIEIEP